MLDNQSIVCMAFPAWDGNYMKSTVELMKEFARHNKVLYIDYAYTWKDLGMAIMGKSNASVNRLMGWSSSIREIELPKGGKIYILSLPPIIPINAVSNDKLYRLLLALNARWVLGRIQKALLTLGMDKPVVINALNPFLGVPLAGKLNEKLLVYYCYDEISAAPWLKKHGGPLEMEYLKKVDVVVTTSEQLREQKSQFHNQCFLVKNGVDIDLFGRKEVNSMLKFLKLGGSPKIIGYLGSVDNRLDYDLLEELVQIHSEDHFVFVGRINDEQGRDRLQKYGNVHLLGPQPPETLPDYVSDFQVGIIPFKKNKLTAGIYPLKINEYLAAGKPVVTTNFSDLSDFESIVQLADTPADFSSALREAIKDNDSMEVERRKSFSAKNSWAGRAEEFRNIIQNLLGGSKKTTSSDHKIYARTND